MRPCHEPACLSRLEKFCQKRINDVRPLPHGNVAGIRNQRKLRAPYGPVELLAYGRRENLIVGAPQNQRRLPDLADSLCEAAFPQGQILDGRPKRLE